jgi:hypothetical protein
MLSSVGGVAMSRCVSIGIGGRKYQTSAPVPATNRPARTQGIDDAHRLNRVAFAVIGLGGEEDACASAHSRSAAD